MSINTMEQQYVECSCSSIEHIARFSYDEEGTYVYVEFFLSEYPFLMRLVKGLKYILGYKCKYGHWDEVVWDKESSFQVHELLKRIHEHA